MALNLSTLTSPATSGDVLQEALTTADFLEPCPVLRNLARGSNKGGDAEQSVALNQPKALPLIDGDGYLYCPTATSNYASVENPIIPATADFDLSVEFVVAKFASGTGYSHIVSQYQGNTSGRVHFGFYDHQKRLYFFCGGDGTNPNVDIKTSVDAIVEGQRHTARVTRVGNTFTLYLDGVLQQTATSGVATLQTVGTQIGWGSLRGLNGAIFSVTEGSNVNVDFTATNVRHGATKFKCATGQVVTINQSGNDPATIIKKPVLRFSSATSGLKGLFANQIDGGYMFAAFSVLGTGVAAGTGSGRVFSVNKTSGIDANNGGACFSCQFGTGTALRTIHNTTISSHNGLYDDTNGDIVHSSKLLNNQQLSKVNNADSRLTTNTTTIEGDEFNIGVNEDGVRVGGENAAIDLEYLALFPATITDAQADAVRNYINNRNNVFYRWDTDGYYFFDPLSLAADAPVSSWNGQIVGSDNDANLTITQSTANSQPDRLAPDKDGMVVRFNDNNDHLIVPAGFVEPADGSWQVVGTSLGTFAYRVNANAVTELNLLGNAGTIRTVGDLYGIILLPESATGREIEQARKLLIDRGAADVGQNATAAWASRNDVIDFKNPNFPDALYLNYSWDGCTNMTQIGSVNAPNSVLFTAAWRNCSSLTSFPENAKLGTEASNVNFTQAWRQSGLTSFPALDLSKGSNFDGAFLDCTSLASLSYGLDMSRGDNFNNTWKNCSSLTSFPENAKLGTDATNVNFQDAWRSSGLTSFSTPLPTAGNVTAAWLGAVYLSSFNTSLPLAFNCNSAWAYCSVMVNFNLTSIPEGIYFSQAFRNSGLVDFNTNLPKANTLSLAFKNCQTLKNFSVDVFANWNPVSIPSGIFNEAWDGCTSLTAQSVENILTSIDSSGKHGTSDGTSGGTALADAGIDIDYDGSGLTAATTAAITSLKSKGWSIFINSVEQ